MTTENAKADSFPESNKEGADGSLANLNRVKPELDASLLSLVFNGRWKR